MNKQNLILDFEDILNTYKSKISRIQLKKLILRNWLPLPHDSDLAKNSAYIIGKLMGDGNLDKHFICRFVGQEEDLTILKESIFKQFSIKKNSMSIRFKRAKGCSYLLQVNDCLFGRFLFSLGAPKGNKTKVEFLVPNWITSSNNLKKYFLQALFEDELATIKIKRKKFFREATFKMAKIEKHQKNLYDFLNQIKELTESLDVQCGDISKVNYTNIQKDGNKTTQLCFRVLGNRKNVVRFWRNIGFRFNQEKIKELSNCITFIKKNAGRGIRTPVSTKEMDFT